MILFTPIQIRQTQKEKKHLNEWLGVVGGIRSDSEGCRISLGVMRKLQNVAVVMVIQP